MQSKGVAPGDSSTPSLSRTSSCPPAPSRSASQSTTCAPTARPAPSKNSPTSRSSQVNGTTIYLRDVATVSDGFQVADQRRSPGRPPRRAHLRPQERQRLHARRRQGHSRSCFRASRTTLPPRAENDASRRSVRLRPRRHRGRHPRRRHRRRAHRLMILLFLGSWRSDAHHRHLHSRSPSSPRSSSSACSARPSIP